MDEVTDPTKALASPLPWPVSGRRPWTLRKPTHDGSYRFIIDADGEIIGTVEFILKRDLETLEAILKEPE